MKKFERIKVEVIYFASLDILTLSTEENGDNWLAFPDSWN